MTPKPQANKTIDEILKDLVVGFLEAVGNEFAPKQEYGSPERKILLGLIAQTTPLTAESTKAIEALITEARIDENNRHNENCHNKTTAFDATEHKLGSSDFIDRIAQLKDKS